MAALTIKDENIQSLTGKVIVLTGGSSGIGLATTKLLLELGASVVSGDINPLPIEHDRLTFVKTNVKQWSDLVSLFDHAKERHGRINHAFANAGVSGRADYLEDKLDESGKLLEPNHEALDVNLKAVVNTAYLGLHHLRHQDPAGGSIVLTASATCFQRFRIADYTTAKHGVLGFMRGMVPNLEGSGLPLRINSLAPGLTETGMVPKGVVEAAGHATQSPDVVARSVALLMADETYQGKLIYSDQGKYWEMEDAMLKTVADIMGAGDDSIMEKIMKMAAQRGPSGGSLPGSSN
ncbi:hypothetical protein B0A55_02086 [Friedmanniomyces simplex]|uniref:Uncharacterized protein n=1 Tax=Friedmanniomyces simplex TaxID=329884 RepID=A0A4U0XXX4_9PEZI|nr:hypothetical protein B0A55_02086 [Friedmanniomyces simplex]